MSASALLMPGCGCCGSTTSGSASSGSVSSGSASGGGVVEVEMCDVLVNVPDSVTIAVTLDNLCMQGEFVSITPMPFEGTFECPLYAFFDDVPDYYELQYMSAPILVDTTTTNTDPPGWTFVQRRWVSVGVRYVVVCDPACGTPGPPILQAREGFFWESSTWDIDPPFGDPCPEPSGAGLWEGSLSGYPCGWVRRDWDGDYDPELVACNDLAFSFSATSGYGLAGCDDSTYLIEVSA